MANLPEKNVVLVDKITNVPTDSNLFINANGEFKQASVNDVVNSSTVVSTAVETAINTAVQDSIDSNFKQTSGSPILLTDSADGTLIDFKGKGRSTQQIKMKQGYYDSLAGTYATNTNAVCNEKPIPCKTGDNIEITVDTTSAIIAIFYNGSSFVSSSKSENTTKATFTIPSNANYYNFDIIKDSSISPSTVGAITITVNGSVGYPRPDYPQAIKNVADSGYFDGELVQGAYNGITGLPTANTYYIRNKNSIPCKSSDTIKLVYGDTQDKLRLFFYKADGTYINKSEVSNTDTIEVTAPTDADNFNFDIVQETIGLTPQNAKPITVTINGKYALIVKSVGKNLWEYGELSFTLSSGVLYKRLKAGTYTISALVTSSGTDATTSVIYFGNAKGDIKGVSLQRGTRNSVTFTLDEDITKMTFYAETNYSNSNKDTATWSDIQIEYGDKVTEYEPYKETVSYIPLNEPLRSSLDGSVTDVASLNEINRKFTEVVFDGSSDEQWLQSTNCFYINLSNANIDTSGYCKALCTHFKNHNVWLDIDGSKVDNSFTIYRYKDWVNARLAFYTSKIKTGAEWTEWLKANPIKVIYELAEPITETIEPVDIVTYDNVTYITASDNADMEIEYPTTKVAGIASIGYSKGIKAEYETEQLKKQLLEIQATIVNTL